MYEGELTDKSLYEKALIEGLEEGVPLRALWKPLSYFINGQAPLYPEGLLGLLTKNRE